MSERSARVKPQAIDVRPTRQQLKGVLRRIFVGDCYRRAFEYVVTHEGARLVHGTIEHAEGPHAGTVFAHAWVDLGDGKIFDGVLQQFFEKAAYYRVLNAKEERSYDQRRAIAMLVNKKTKTWGPWYKTKGRLEKP